MQGSRHGQASTALELWPFGLARAISAEWLVVVGVGIRILCILPT